MRILIFSWKDVAHPCAGGAEVYTHEIARRWVARGHHVTVFSSAVDGLAAHDWREGVELVRRGGRYSVYAAARRYWDQEAEGHFDLVIDEVNTRPFLCPEWVRTAPVVALIFQLAREVWFHEMPLAMAAVGRYWLEPHWLRAYQDVPVLTISASSRASLLECGLRNVSLVPAGAGVPEHLPKPVKEECPTVIFVGRLAPNKQPDHAIAAFADVVAGLPEAQLWVVGAGPLKERLRRQACDRVTFFGAVSEDEKFRRLARAHVLVVPSVREGWGLVVDEAAAVGTRAIGYDVPGLRDSIPAAGGVIVRGGPAALAVELLRRLPGWTAESCPRGWKGGALDWDSVADLVLERAMSVAGRAPVAASTEARTDVA